MNEALKLDNLKDYAQNVLKTEVDKNFLWAYTDGGPAFKSKNFILIFEEDQLIINNLSMMGDFTGDFTVIPYRDLQEISYSTKLFGMAHEIKVVANGKTTKYKFAKKVLGAPWQFDNLDNIKEKGYLDQPSGAW